MGALETNNCFTEKCDSRLGFCIFLHYHPITRRNHEKSLVSKRGTRPLSATPVCTFATVELSGRLSPVVPVPVPVHGFAIPWDDCDFFRPVQLAFRADPRDLVSWVTQISWAA